MSQPDASMASGVNLDNLRRYESGKTIDPPASALQALGSIYGHAVEDFMNPAPPPAKLGERVKYQLRSLPGVEITPELHRKFQELIASVERDKATGKKKR